MATLESIQRCIQYELSVVKAGCFGVDEAGGELVGDPPGPFRGQEAGKASR